MNRRSYHTLLLIAMLLSVISSTAQIQWDTLYLQNDLSPNYTNDIIFDKHHYMWINTSRGLYRVDGNEARYYVHNPEDSLSLINNIVTKVYEDRDGQLWVLTDKGVQSYDHKTETFSTVLKDYIEEKKDSLFKYGFESAMQVDDAHILFGTKDGGVLYHKYNHSYKYISILDKTETTGYSSLAHVVSIVPDQSDDTAFYLLTKSGIFSFNSITHKVDFIFNTSTVDFASIGPPGMSMVAHGDYLYFIVRKEVYSYHTVTGKCTAIGMSKFLDLNIVLRDIIISADNQLIISTTNSGIFSASLNPPHNPTLVVDGLYNQLAFDPAGHLVTIANTSDIVLSKQLFGEPSQISPSLNIDKIWINNNRKLLREVFREEVYKLRDFERDIDVTISLNQYDSDATVNYFYQLDDLVWREITSGRKLSLRDLDLGNHSLQFKAEINSNEILSSKLNFYIDRYFYERWWFRFLILSTIVFFVAAIYYLLRSLKKNRDHYNKQVIEMELNALRSQMNPHFIFNTLNSIKNYVLTKTPDDAAYYLTKFAQLIRSILENSKVPFLTLQQEINSIKLYVEMEHLRFGGEFDYEIDIDEEIDTLQFKIAPMLIQPFIENAIWHGLMSVKTERQLFIQFHAVRDGVECVIEDNGIGLTKSKAIQAKRNQHKKSLGLDITLDRIKNINLLYQIDAKVEIEDRLPKGTKVTIYLPSLDNQSR